MFSRDAENSEQKAQEKGTQRACPNDEAESKMPAAPRPASLL